MQFDTTVNEWHTCPNSARINASNPCSEYMFLDDSACNLSSLNLMKFVRADGEFDTEAFKAAVRTLITAQEIIVDNSSYPTKAIEKNSHAYRPLGLGYANLGALLMSRGLPYDSDAGRDYAAAITALMTGEAYAQSARVARDHGGPFCGLRAQSRTVPARHAQASRCDEGHHRQRTSRPISTDAAKQSWDEAVELGEDFGYRNAQATVLAPTGTIGFMMDCDTTGVEPDIALVKYKKLVGGGMMKIVNMTVPMALEEAGLHGAAGCRTSSPTSTSSETIEGAPHLLDRDLPVFDCAFKAANGERSIHYMGHIKMMGATQPFISGAISKTVNVPKDATVEEIEQAYIESWRLGAKAISIYRDGSKRTQPLNTSKDRRRRLRPSVAEVAQAAGRPLPRERRCGASCPTSARPSPTSSTSPATRATSPSACSRTGSPGEIFLVMAKEGSTISGFADAFAQAISYALQFGVPLQALVDKFSHVRFEPSGMTKNPDVRFAKSIVDYIFRWMATKFLSPEAQYVAGVNNRDDVAGNGHAAESVPAIAAPPQPKAVAREAKPSTFAAIQNQEDAPPCSTCGSIMVRSGACYKCTNCGTTSGCA